MMKYRTRTFSTDKPDQLDGADHSKSVNFMPPQVRVTSSAYNLATAPLFSVVRSGAAI